MVVPSGEKATVPSGEKATVPSGEKATVHPVAVRALLFHLELQASCGRSSRVWAKGRRVSGARFHEERHQVA